MLIIVRIVFTFAIMFWTFSYLPSASASEVNLDISPVVGDSSKANTSDSTEFPHLELDEDPQHTETNGEKNDQSESSWISKHLGLKNRHSLVYGSILMGSATNAGLNGRGFGVEVGYEKSQWRLFKWGPYFSYDTFSFNEEVNFPNTGYVEDRNNNVSTMSLGVRARYGLLRYLDVRSGLGLSNTSLKINDISTTAPTASTSVGYTESYPLSLDGFLGFSVTKTINKWGFAGELSYRETALGMQQSLSIISMNLTIRYLYNR